MPFIAPRAVTTTPKHKGNFCAMRQIAQGGGGGVAAGHCHRPARASRVDDAGEAESAMRERATSAPSARAARGRTLPHMSSAKGEFTRHRQLPHEAQTAHEGQRCRQAHLPFTHAGAKNSCHATTRRAEPHTQEEGRPRMPKTHAEPPRAASATLYTH